MLRTMKWSYCQQLKQSLAKSICTTSDYSVGDKLHGYTIDSVQELPEIAAVAVRLSHDRTGAQHLHVSKDDPNNTFSVGFCTIPEDNTGVAHILEHTTLCGSRKYPVRDPFFKMLNRSLSNFMNAFTSNDWTMYPFSTQNKEDFKNLMSVYLDCVFFPLLRDFDFKQEGWRLEHTDVDDKESPAVFKGVVFNEMKGCYANSDYQYSEAIQKFLLPSTTYSFSSGGQPISIVDLTMEKLKKFHSEFYHPSNAKFFTYGNFSLESHLCVINNDILCHFKKKTLPIHFCTQSDLWDEPKSQHIYCAPDASFPDKKKTGTFSMSYLLSPITDRYSSFVLMFLCHILSDGPSSYFYKALLDSNIGYKYSPGTGYLNETLQSYFSIGVKGIEACDVQQIQEVIQSTFIEASRIGFSDERISSIIHQMELTLKFQEENLGLKLATEIISPWVHGADPLECLLGNKLIERFKAEVCNDYLRERLYKYFIDNKHILKLTMSPLVNYEQSLKDEEDAKLNSVVSKLSKKEFEHLFECGIELKLNQNKNQDVSVLPTVQLADISIEGNSTTIQNLEGTYPIYYHNESTNGLLYLSISASFQSLPEELKMYIPLFCHIITRMGAGDFNYSELSQQFNLCMGGLSVVPYVLPHHTLSNGYFEEILCSSYCTMSNVVKMLALWKDVFLCAHFKNEQRLHNLLKEFSSNLAENMILKGHQYSMKLSSSSLTPSAKQQENLFGVTQIKFLRELLGTSETQDMLLILNSIARHVFSMENIRVFWTGSHDDNSLVSNRLQDFLVNFSLTGPTEIEQDHVSIVPSFKSETGDNIFLVLPCSINYVSQSLKTVPYSHPDSSKLQLLARLLNSKYLHKNIREIGGAYGSAAMQTDGIFSLSSYRDPNVEHTLKVYEGASKWLRDSVISERDINEAKFAVFSEIDSPVSLQNKGMHWFLTRRSEEHRQLYRDKLLSIEHKDVIDACEKYLVKERNSCVIGPSKTLNGSWTLYKF